MAILCMAISATGCKKPEEALAGTWKREDAASSEILEIYNDGGHFQAKLEHDKSIVWDNIKQISESEFEMYKVGKPVTGQSGAHINYDATVRKHYFLHLSEANSMLYVVDRHQASTDTLETWSKQSATSK